MMNPNQNDLNYTADINNTVNPDIINAVAEIPEKPATVTTAIAEVSAVPAITETSNFQMVLQEIPKRVLEADALLKEYRANPKTFLDSVDDATLDLKIKEMDEVAVFVRDIDKSRTEIRQYMNKVRDNLITTLDKRLDDASFNELSRAQRDIKQLKQDILNDRRDSRWEELKATFEANVNRYPLLAEFAPELADFSKFKLIHSGFVSGAKTRKIRDKEHTFVNDTVYAWNTAIEVMKENEWGLSPQDLNQLLTMFKQNPSVDLVNREGRQLKSNAEAKEKAKLEADALRKQREEQALIEQQKRQAEMVRVQEQMAQAKLAQDKDAQARAEQQRVELEARAKQQLIEERQRQAEFSQFGGQYQTIFKESFPKFIGYLFTNPAYHDVHSNPGTKAAVVYDIMRQVERADSIVSLETQKDPQKVLDLVRYILDA